ncbi:MAG TPA: alpha-glucan family phosphorylase, partial [Minicystis sp.]|nr:alpha-glucan family phosphorylase [Minicystis sp.]
MSDEPAQSDGPDDFGQLADLALDQRWSWKHEGDALFSEIDPDLWRATGNPWAVVRSASPKRLRALWATPAFRARVDALAAARGEHAAASAWFQEAHADAPISTIAYFCLEFALSEALPIYSGGLGNVAGDLLKTASDLGVPLVGVSLLYQQGYFRQAIDATGAQHEFYPFNDTSLLPVLPLRDAEGDWVRVRLPMPGRAVWLRGWEARVGRARLLLLDSNDPANAPADRGITAELYGGGADVRLAQEMALGVGGHRLLCAAGVRPEVCHLNEGHAAFVVLERARELMSRQRIPFAAALSATRAGNVFTTHTPVDAGFDRFPPELVRGTLAAYAETELGIGVDELLALGRADPESPFEPLNMAWLAVRGSGAVNAVSRVHAGVSRRLFQVLFPRWPEREVPIDCVTNGVHVPSWDSAEADALWTEACGAERWRGTLEDV